MDGRGGCCIARYSGGCGGGDGDGEMSYGISKVDKIMLRFRPIAPKPMSAGSGSSCSTMENSDGHGGTRRRKRKYVRINGNKTNKATTTVSKKQKATTTVSKNQKASASSTPVSGGGDAVVTLSLMPETPDRKENSPATTSPIENRNKSAPILLSFDNQLQQTVYDGHVRVAGGHVVSVTDHAVMMTSPAPPPPQNPQIISYVVVECVTDTWENGGCLGFADMEMDTCPCFITDNQDTVVWTNKAYREMTAGGSDETAAVVVKKYNRVTMPLAHAAFTCKVKVTWGNEKVTSPSTLTAPCDVWRLRSGVYAWRLDVKAALSLGL